MLRAHHRFYLAAFFMDFAASAAFTSIPFFIYDQLEGGARMSGGVGGLQSIAYGLTCLLSSGFVQRAKNGLTWAIVGGVSFSVLVPFATVFRSPWLFALCTVSGIASLALFWPALQAWVGAEPNPRTRVQRIGIYNITWNVALAVAPLFAGPLYDVHHLLPFAMVTATGLIGVALVVSLPHESSHLAAVSTDHGESNVREDRYAESHVHAAWVANLVAWGMVGVMRSVFPKRVAELTDAGTLVIFAGNAQWEHLAFPAATQFSWIMLAMYASRAGISFVMGTRHGWRHRFGLLVLPQLAAAVAFFILGSTESLALMMVCCAIVGVNGGVQFFASLYYSVSNPALKHRRAAIHESMVGLGGFAGAILFGELAERFGTPWPFMLAPAIVGVGLLTQLTVLRLRRRATNPRD